MIYTLPRGRSASPSIVLCCVKHSRAAAVRHTRMSAEFWKVSCDQRSATSMVYDKFPLSSYSDKRHIFERDSSKGRRPAGIVCHHCKQSSRTAVLKESSEEQQSRRYSSTLTESEVLDRLTSMVRRRGTFVRRKRLNGRKEGVFQLGTGTSCMLR